MQRRKFIKETLTGLPLLALTPSLLAGACRKEEEYDPNGKTVIIIGAGIAGLAAGKTLKEKGFQVSLLEAQNKVGGRISTNRTLGVAFDEGASWIHGINGNPISSLAQQAGMNTVLSDEESLIAYDLKGVIIPKTTFNNAEAELENILSTLKNSGSNTQSFESVFNNLYPAKVDNRLWKFLLSTYITFDLGDLDKVSSTLYDEGEVFSGEERIATNGYDTLVNYLAQGLQVELNQRVTKINYAATKPQVTHNGKVSEADFVVVTVPLGVLKSGNIEFVPALPAAKQTAIEKIGMNCVNKFLLTWDNAFWDDTLYLCYTPETRDKFNYFLNLKKVDKNLNALMTFAYANYARQTESMTDAQVIEEIMAYLKDIYGTSIPQPLGLLRTKWQSNENAFGAYSFTQVGTEMQHFDDLAEEIQDRLFFAGEHTHIDYFSTAHGAYLSGIREAEKIMELI